MAKFACRHLDHDPHAVGASYHSLYVFNPPDGGQPYTLCAACALPMIGTERKRYRVEGLQVYERND